MAENIEGGLMESSIEIQNQRKKVAIKVLYSIKTIIERIIYLLKGSEKNINSHNFESLGAKNDLEISIYSNSIDWALKENNIYNIAITGPYGSGKSSVLMTYEKNNIKNKKNKFLNISLASFIESEDTKLIEESILQQMFYKVKGDKLPYSRFKRIKNKNEKYIFFYSLLFIIWGICTKLSLELEVFKVGEFLKKWDKIIMRDKVAFGVFLLGSIAILMYLYKVFTKLTLKIKGIDLEVKKEETGAIFNKYFDEILYFFETQKFNVVFFEDLDRIKDSIKVFTKLRELNLLLNKSDHINKKIVFIYAVKDDLFEGETRTKFFDFLIPVIPKINSSNSAEALIKRLEKSEGRNPAFEKLKKSINDFSLYIDDMRILNNICNEFIIYKNKLNTEALKLEKLFAIIVYKNKFPQDFSALHLNKGMVYDAFQKRNSIIKLKVEEKESEIKKIKEEIKEKIEEYRKENIKDLKELRAVYMGALIENYPNAIKFDNHSLEELLKTEEIFEMFWIEGKIINYTYNTGGYYSLTEEEQTTEYKVEAVENSIGKSYKERKLLIETKNENRIKELRQNIEKLEIEKSEIYVSSLKDLITSENLTQIFKKETIEKKLLIFLIREGYLDEKMYHTYISFFYEGNLTAQDRVFLLSIKNQEILEYNFLLTNKDKIISKLSLTEFEREGVRNFDLLDYIIENLDKTDCKIYFSILMKKLKIKNQNDFDFVDKYFSRGKNIEEFIEKICNLDKEFWDEIVNGISLTEEKKKSIY